VNVGVELGVAVEVIEGMGLSMTVTLAAWQAASVNAIKETISLMIFIIN